jgi:hypothetical protein
MSNFLAVAAVTETLRQLLDSTVANDVPGASATVMRPDKGAAAAAPTANIYLYRIAPNPGFRGSDLPTRRPSAEFQSRPAIGLDLHYLLTFFGNDEQLEPHRLMGSAIRTLHAFPLLTRNMITDALASTTMNFLTRSDLANQPELVKFTPAVMTLDELTKLWSVFFQTPYALSVGYEASMVCLEHDEAISTPLPVRTRTLRVIPFGQPVISSVEPDTGKHAPIVVGSTLRILGERLTGDLTRVRIGGELITPDSATPTEIVFRLKSPQVPASALRAGVQGLQVVHHVNFGVPGDPHRGDESPIAPIVVRPRITSATGAAGKVTLHVSPPVRANQRAVLLLNQQAADKPPAVAIPRPPTDSNATTLTFNKIDLPAGTYFVRVQVDGAESPIDLDPSSATFGPQVTLP